MRRIMLRSVVASSLVLVIGVGLVIVTAGVPSIRAQEPQMDQAMAVVIAFNQARERCYSAPDCPGHEALMALFSPDARRTEVQRNNNVVLLEGPDALRADNLRVASSFTGRRLETTAIAIQGRNVIVQQMNWDPGASTPNPFTSVFRVEDGKIAHWVLIAP